MVSNRDIGFVHAGKEAAMKNRHHRNLFVDPHGDRPRAP